MFVCSLRASTVKFFGVTVLALAALVALLVFIPSAESDMTESVAAVDGIRYDKIKTAEDRIEFLRQFGWEVDPTALEEVKVTVPSEFDKVHTSYNELQLEQGFDLTKYHKKDVMRYTYRITNYPDYDGEVYANILVYKKQVIGGDICSADASGFIHGLDRNIGK